MLVATEIDRIVRERDLILEEQKKLEEIEEQRKNRSFTQVYPKGWKKIGNLAKGNPGAFGLYTFFAEHIDASCGAVVADQKFLANTLKVSTRTIQRWLDYLEENNALVRIPVAGKVCAYALNPEEVWKGYNTSKNYAAFVTKTLVNKNGDIQRRLTAMFDGKKNNN